MNNWFPTGMNGNEEGWRLDIVSLLAVIGESSIESHSQALTSSWTCILPRIIPAPQVLLKPSRPNRMPQVNAIIVGVHNGTMVESLNFFPNIIHPIEDLAPFAFKVYEIRHKRDVLIESTEELSAKKHINTKSATSSSFETTPMQDPEHGPTPRPLPRHGTVQRATRRMTEKINSLTKEKKRPTVPPQKFSPLNILNVVSCAVTFALIGVAGKLGDGTAMVALGTMALTASIVGYASWWQPRLMQRDSNSKVPPGDVIIRTREGAFILIKCNEDVARELYFGTEECFYFVKTQPYRVLVGLGTFLLMISVVLLGNCNFYMQAAIGASYISLNGAFWAISLLKKKMFWDLSSYEAVECTPEDAIDAHLKDVPKASRAATPDALDAYRPLHEGKNLEVNPSFTRTMWYAIRETKKIGWVKRGGAAPTTTKWDEWLNLAEENATKGNRTWKAVKMREEIVGRADAEQQAQAAHTSDTAEQHVPGIEVAPPASK